MNRNVPLAELVDVLNGADKGWRAWWILLGRLPGTYHIIWRREERIGVRDPVDALLEDNPSPRE